MPCIIFISTFNVLPTEISLLLFFAVDRVTRHIFKVRLLVPCRMLLLEASEVLLCVIQCDKMRNKVWGRSATEYLNKNFLCSSDCVLVGLALLS